VLTTAFRVTDVLFAATELKVREDVACVTVKGSTTLVLALKLVSPE
jgi:hypothetical protein